MKEPLRALVVGDFVFEEVPAKVKYRVVAKVFVRLVLGEQFALGVEHPIVSG